MADSHETEYAGRLLNMNPLDHASEILALRKQFLHPRPAGSASIEAVLDPAARREQTLQAINELKETFWSLDEAELQERLESIDISDYPDLTLALSRFKTAAAHYKSFQRLKQHPDCFDIFFNQFSSLVLDSPREASELRATYLKTIFKRRKQSEAHAPKDYFRVASLVQRDFPALNALERTWIGQIIEKQKQAAWINKHDIYLGIVALIVITVTYFSIKFMFQ